MVELRNRVFFLNIFRYMVFSFGWLWPLMAVAAEPDYLAYGDMRGYLEPCGCDPATDLGGILRINSQLKRERLNRPQVPVYNLGNNLSEKERDTIKNKYLLLADEKNQPTAYLVNVQELLFAKDVRGKKILQMVKLPFLLSNGRKGSIGQPHIETKEVVVFGYTWAPSIAAEVKKISPEILLDWKKTITAKNEKTPVLLFAGPDEHLAQIVDTKLFSAIISSNKNPIDQSPGKEEVENEGFLVRNASPAIYMVPLGGQGILRGGSMTTSEAKTVESYFRSPEKSCSDKSTKFGSPECGGPSLFAIKYIRVTWLRKEAESGHDLAGLYKEYNQEVSVDFKEKSKGRLLALKNSQFAGSAACEQCHPSQTAVYKKSKHAHAIQILIDRHKHENPECVQCHVVGADKPGGFVSVADSPQLANVQCENCHGPRKEHAKNPAIKHDLKVDRHVCETCHNAQHSPKFEFAKYWERIKH